MHSGSQLYFVMGGDSFRDFSKWHAPDEIIKHCRLAVMRRPSTRPMQPTMHDYEIPNLSDYVDIIEAPPIGISATRVREQIKAGKSVRYLVPNPVLAYINKKNLYQE
jgi:nicotinate-nucleotide adenylyltransferase